jgi:hypothetical protein
VFAAGLAQLRVAHAELSRADLAPHTRYLRLGARLWREGRRDRDTEPEDWTLVGESRAPWTADLVTVALERLALRAALAVRRARWLTRLTDAAVVWSEGGMDGARLLLLVEGECVWRGAVPADTPPPVPPGCHRRVADRRAGFTLARFDRVRVLLTELKRLAGEGRPLALRAGAGPPLTGARLARVLAWL